MEKKRNSREASVDQMSFQNRSQGYVFRTSFAASEKSALMTVSHALLQRAFAAWDNVGN
jgi:hypothetical protein